MVRTNADVVTFPPNCQTPRPPPCRPPHPPPGVNDLFLVMTDHFWKDSVRTLLSNRTLGFCSALRENHVLIIYDYDDCPDAELSGVA